MADDHTVGAPRKPAVGDQTNRIAKPEADDSRSRSEHLAHSGAAFGAFIANHNDVANLDVTFHDRGHAVLFRFEYFRRPGDLALLDARDLRDGTILGKVSPEDRNMPFCVNWPVERTDYVLVLRRFVRYTLQILSDRFAGDRDAVAME